MIVHMLGKYKKWFTEDEKLTLEVLKNMHKNILESDTISIVSSSMGVISKYNYTDNQHLIYEMLSEQRNLIVYQNLEDYILYHDKDGGIKIFSKELDENEYEKNKVGVTNIKNNMAESLRSVIINQIIVAIIDSIEAKTTEFLTYEENIMSKKIIYKSKNLQHSTTIDIEGEGNVIRIVNQGKSSSEFNIRLNEYNTTYPSYEEVKKRVEDL